MKLRFLLLFLLLAFGINASLFAAAGDKLPTAFALTGTCSLSGTTGSVLTPVYLPNGGNYVLTGVDIVILSGTAVAAAPTVQVASGATNLSSSAALSGTVANTVVRPTISNPVSLVATSGTTTPLSLNIVTAGTATVLNVKTVFRGYFLP